MNCKDWKDLFAPHILMRGQTYYQDGAVETLQQDGDEIRAAVLGTERYQVEISLEGDRIGYWSCDCPYASDGTPCKHLAAVFYALEERKPEPVRKEPQTPVRELVERLDLETARALLLRLAEREERIADQIRLAVAPFSDHLVDRWKSRIDRLMEEAGDRDGYIAYDRAWDAMCELEELISDAAGQFLASGHIWEAFSLTGYAFLSAFQCEVDDSDGGLTMLADRCTDLWEEQADAAPPEMKRRMHQWFQDTCQKTNGLCQNTLMEAQWSLFHEPDLLRDNIAQLDRMIQAEQEREHRSYGPLPWLVLKRLELMDELGMPQEEIWQAAEQHRALPDVRKQMVRRLLEEKRYSDAEALLVESKTLDQAYPGLVSRYSNQLIGLYEETGQEEKLQEELQFQVFQCRQDSLTDVKKLKERTGPEQWPELRERLLTGKTLDETLQDELLALDGLYDRLMERVAAMGSLPLLDRWETVLRPRFPERVQESYLRCLERQMHYAGNRKQYAAVIAWLKKLRDTPDRADLALVRQWRAAYPRRRSMLDELRKAGY